MKINVIPRGVMASMLMLAVISLIYYSTAALAERGGNGNGKNKDKGPTITQNFAPVLCDTPVTLFLDETNTIGVGLEESQCFIFKIIITGANTDDVFVDNIGAVWDLDPPGIDEDSYMVKSGACEVILTQPASILNTNPPDQQPEHITIVMDEVIDPDTAACTVDIYVRTAKKRNSAIYHPGGCDYLSDDLNDDDVSNPGTNPGLTADDNPLMDMGGYSIENGEVDTDILSLPMVDWVALNDGAKGYEASKGGLLMSIRGYSHQLRPMGCDFDGDGFDDADDDCPIEFGESTDEEHGEDGCIIIVP